MTPKLLTTEIENAERETDMMEKMSSIWVTLSLRQL